MSATPLDTPRPPWREPLVWMVFGIPAATVVAGFATWWIAAQRADSNVAEDWYKRGLTINRSLERESHAQARGLQAEIRLADANDLRVTLTGTGPLPATIAVVLTHPVRAEQDRRVTLQQQADGAYRIVSPMVAGGRWDVAIEAEDWRVAGRRVELREGRTIRVSADGRVD